MNFVNVYDNSTRADSYSKLEFANTYHLAFRDLPDLYRDHVKGARALDFGCGTGRSTRFLCGLGFDVIGVDISDEMLARARQVDPEGDYRLIPGDDMSALPPASFSLIQSAFTFDNIPGADTKARLFRDLRTLLAPGGILVNIVSAPEIYVNEWASFSTKDFPENRQACAGDHGQNHHHRFRRPLTRSRHPLAARILCRNLCPSRSGDCRNAPAARHRR